MKPPKNNDTPPTLIVKPEVMDDRLLKQSFKMQLQGQGLMAFNAACKARAETPQQFINDLLEAYLIREGYLPGWWLSRGKGIS